MKCSKSNLTEEERLIVQSHRGDLKTDQEGRQFRINAGDKVYQSGDCIIDLYSDLDRIALKLYGVLYD